MKPITILFLVGLSFGFQAQNLLPYFQDSLYGFTDKNGKVIIEPKYDNLTKFGSPYLLNEENGNDKIRSTATEIRLDLKLAHVKEDGEWYVINKKGEPILPGRSSKPFKIISLISAKSFYSKSNVESLDTSKAVMVLNTSTDFWTLYFLDTEKKGAHVYKYHNSKYLEEFKTPLPSPFLIANFDVNFISNVQKYGSRFDKGFPYGAPPPTQHLLDRKTGLLVIPDKIYINKIGKNSFLYTDIEGNSYHFDTRDRTSTLLPYTVKEVLLSSGRKIDVSPWSKIWADEDDHLHYAWSSPFSWRLTPLDSMNEILHYFIGAPRKYGLADANFNFILDTIYKRIRVNKTHLIANKKDGDALLFSREGHPVPIPAGRAIFMVKVKRENIPAKDRKFLIVLHSGKWVVVDAKGELLLDREFDHIEQRIDKLQFKDGEISGLIDMDGKIEVSFVCDKIWPLQNFDENYKDETLYMVERDTVINGYNDDARGLITSYVSIIMTKK